LNICEHLMYIYRAYQLGIHSSLPLPELVPASQAPADITIRLSQVDMSAAGLPREGTQAHVGAEVSTFFWDQIGAYEARNGREIIVDPLPDVEERLVRLPLLGTVLAVLLQQRRLWVLHASAVAIHGRAVLLMGPKGQGKSTITAALFRRGHWLVADDVVALVPTPGGAFMALPGFPQCKLWPDAAHAIGIDPEDLRLLASGFEKRAHPIRERFAGEAAPVACVCAIAEGQAMTLRVLPPQQALSKLIAYTYVARFGDMLLRGAAAAAHLKQCAALIRNTPVCQFERPRDLALLDHGAELLESFVGSAEVVEII
jgi:hypothetical protein